MNLLEFLRRLFPGLFGVRSTPALPFLPTNVRQEITDTGDFYQAAGPNLASSESQANTQALWNAPTEVERRALLGLPPLPSLPRPPLVGYAAAGSKFVSDFARERSLVTPSPDESGATQWADVLAANQGNPAMATRAWNSLQARTAGYADPGPGAPRIIGWNWGQPLYAGQRSQGSPSNPLGFGPYGQYTAPLPFRRSPVTGMRIGRGR